MLVKRSTNALTGAELHPLFGRYVPMIGVPEERDRLFGRQGADHADAATRTRAWNVCTSAPLVIVTWQTACRKYP